MKKLLYVLYGGPSSEHEVSFGTKDFFLDLYKEVNPVSIKWNKDFSFEFKGDTYEESDILDLLTDGLVIIAAHGEYVEDGYIQKKFEDRGIAFTGSTSEACRLAMDKYKSMCSVCNLVKVPLTYKASLEKFDIKKMPEIIGDTFPIFVKPLDLGSSVGVYKVNSKADLLALLPKLTYEKYLFQEAIEGMEVSLGSVREGESFMELLPTEIIPSTEFFDYEAKYTVGASTEITPARIDKELLLQLRDITNKIHNALGLGYYSRSDFIIKPSGEIYYLETNALPGMTKTSLVPQQLRHANKMEKFKGEFLRCVIS